MDRLSTLNTQLSTLNLFVAPHRRLDVLKNKRFHMPRRLCVLAAKLPGGDVGKMVVIALRFAVGILKLLAEMATARLAALQRIQTEELAEFEEVRHAAGLFECDIQRLVLARHIDVLPELRTKCGNAIERAGERLLRAGHPAQVPHQQAELAVKAVD